MTGDPASEDYNVPVEKQEHIPVFFLSGKLHTNQLARHISQKEMYPVMHSFKRVPYMVLGHRSRINIFTDHKNIINVLNPISGPNSAYLDGLTRWGLIIQQVDI